MTSNNKTEKKNERPKQRGNLGQKEAQQEQMSRTELVHMAELIEAGKVKKDNKQQS